MRDVKGRRLEGLLASFDASYGTNGRRLVRVEAPARTEIAGNHTDHEGGDVIAGALNRSILGVAAANGTNEVRLSSEGFDPITVSLDELEPRADEKVTTKGLVRGMAAQLATTGRTPQGFDLVMTSDSPSGGGLSSSAALELAIGRVMETLWEGPTVNAPTLARMGQISEQRYFGKPCGLMDQMSVAVGGIAHMSFLDPENPVVTRLDFDFERAGYAICLVDVGCDHSRFTDEYAAVTDEMRAVAQHFGQQYLSEVSAADFWGRLREVRASAGDRAVLRAAHFFDDNARVPLQAAALAEGRFADFLELVSASGVSSAMQLQNLFSTSQPQQQAVGVSLALAAHLLGGRGAVRVHGGGFAGTIQAYVPTEMAEEFRAGMNRVLGAGRCWIVRIRPAGGVVIAS